MIAGSLQYRGQQVSKERGIVDKQNRWGSGARRILVAEPVVGGERQEMSNIDDLGCLAANDGGAEDTRPFAYDFDLKLVLHNIDDFVDGKADGSVAVGKHQYRLYAACADVDLVAERNERHQLFAVLNHMPAAGEFDASGVDFFQPGYQRKRHRFKAGRAGPEQEQRGERFIAANGWVIGRLRP